MTDVFALIIDTEQDDSGADIQTLSTNLTTMQKLVDGSIEAVYGFRDINGTVRTASNHVLPQRRRQAAFHSTPSPPRFGGTTTPGTRQRLPRRAVIVTGYHPSGHDINVPEDVIDTYVALAHLILSV